MTLWRDSYSIGVDAIDEQHRDLLLERWTPRLATAHFRFTDGTIVPIGLCIRPSQIKKTGPRIHLNSSGLSQSQIPSLMFPADSCKCIARVEDAFTA